MQQDDPQSQLDQVKDLVAMYMDTLKEGGREYMVQIEASDLAKKMK